MTASGVCHSDLHVRDGDWERPGPIVLGHEGAGVIEAVGPGLDPGFVGRAVALSWYAPCLHCRECQRGRQWLCSGSPSLRHAQADGTTRLSRADGSPVLAYLSIGTMATAQVVPATRGGPDARRRAARGRGAHRVRRVDGRRGGASRPPRCPRARPSR